MKPYVVVMNKDLTQLEAEVNQLLRDGYEPLGGLVVVTSGWKEGDASATESAFCQALVHYADEGRVKRPNKFYSEYSKSAP